MLNVNNSLKIKNLFYFILILSFCGNLAVINGDLFYNKFDFLSNFYPLIDTRINENYKIFIVNYLIMFFVLFLFPFFGIRNIFRTKFSKIEFFITLLLFHRLLSNIIVDLSSFFSGNIGIFLMYLFYISLFILVLSYIRNNSDNYKFYNGIKSIIIFSSVLNSLMIVYQFFIEYKYHYPGFSLIDSFRYIRPIGLMGAITVNSMFIGFGIIIILWDIFFQNIKQNIKKKYILLAVMLIGELFSGSRGGFTFVIIIFTIHFFLDLRTRNVVNLIKFIAVSIIGCLPIIIIFNDFFINYFNSVFASDSAVNSNESRLMKWKIAFKIFQDNPFLGVGAGKYGEIQSSLTSGWSSSNPHNLLMQLLSENGIIYTLCFFLTVIIILAKSFIKFKETPYYPVFLMLLYWLFSSSYLGALDNLTLGISFILLLALSCGLKYNKTP